MRLIKFNAFNFCYHQYSYKLVVNRAYEVKLVRYALLNSKLVNGLTRKSSGCNPKTLCTSGLYVLGRNKNKASRVLY